MFQHNILITQLRCELAHWQMGWMGGRDDESFQQRLTDRIELKCGGNTTAQLTKSQF